MNVPVFDVKGQKVSDLALPTQFGESVRTDVVRRAVLAQQAAARQLYGANPVAGMQVSATLSRRRRDYKSGYGRGQSRVPRKTLWRRGTQFYFVGAEAPGTVGGRRAHAPKSSKIWTEKINRKERRKAIRSAMAASLDAEYVLARGHKAPENFPFILDNSFESLSKTADVVAALKALNLTAELERCDDRSIRAGKGKMRNRKYKSKKGPLLVVSSPCELTAAARNVPGIDVCSVRSLNAELLAPGSAAGRLTLYTAAAIDALTKEELFM